LTGRIDRRQPVRRRTSAARAAAASAALSPARHSADRHAAATRKPTGGASSTSSRSNALSRSSFAGDESELAIETGADEVVEADAKDRGEVGDLSDRMHRHRPFEAVEHPPLDICADQAVELGLTAEVVVQRSGGDAGVGRDRGHRDRVEALRPEEFERGFDEPAAGRPRNR
jgi:hypothetical protein